MRQDKPGVKV